MDTHRERAHLVAYLASQHTALISYADPDEPDWPVIYISTAEGQMSWHLSEDDLDLFGPIPFVGPDKVTWDGHTTEEKYARLDRLTDRPYARQRWVVVGGTPQTDREDHMSYVDHIREQIAAREPDLDPALLDLYTLLALTTGANTSMENVHDAWALWRSRTQPDHPSLVPFEELSEETQELDRPYAEAIAQATVAHVDVQGT